MMVLLPTISDANFAVSECYFKILYLYYVRFINSSHHKRMLIIVGMLEKLRSY